MTAIGRGINSTAKEKHNIKRADRLCSNVILQSELLNIYGGIVRRFVASNRPRIHVDWSDFDVSKRNFLIRASVALDGRSITIYQEVHSIKTKEKPASHLAFLTKPVKAYNLITTLGSQDEQRNRSGHFYYCCTNCGATGQQRRKQLAQELYDGSLR